jgi:hypothetical protein
MQQDEIAEVGIDERGRLYVRPATSTFPYIWREAMEVHWDVSGAFLHSPVPREWSYADWYRQIVSAAQEQAWELRLTPRTRWTNVPEEVRVAITAEPAPRA